MLVGVWQPVLLAPPGSVTRSLCLGTGCCQKACGGHSGRVSLGSLSERLGMGRAGSRMASPLRNTHTHTQSWKVRWRPQVMSYIGFGEERNFEYSGDLTRQQQQREPRMRLAAVETKKKGEKQANVQTNINRDTWWHWTRSRKTLRRSRVAFTFCFFYT